MLISPGQRIVNDAKPDSGYGTVGGLVRTNNGLRLLTCFHSIFTAGMHWDQSAPPAGTEGVKIGDAGGLHRTAGIVMETLRDERVDGALISPAGGNTATGQIPIFGATQGLGYLNDDDHGRWLRKYGAATQDTYGQFQGFYPYSNRYEGEAAKFQLNSLIMIRTNDGAPFSAGGDSGAFVLNQLNQVVGIIVMGDGTTSYAIQAAILESRLNIQFI